LNPDEWAEMRQHPIYAYELLRQIKFLEPALNIPYSHHERWDGTGYPRGLKEEEIPLEARIFALVDVWDALTSERPYRKALAREEVIQYIRDNSGSHFDPNLSERFIKMIERDG
jgi:HD-GYP domain-containing protein (c-di-GMP phosphodiesterase class II)